MDSLKELCQEELKNYVDTENVVVLLQQSLLFQAEKLRSACLKYLFNFLVRSIGKEEDVPGFEELDEDIRAELADMKKHRAPSRSSLFSGLVDLFGKHGDSTTTQPQPPQQPLQQIPLQMPQDFNFPDLSLQFGSLGL